MKRLDKQTYEDSRTSLIDYLRMKVHMEDWHGVSDAANDLRELDARWSGITEGKTHDT